jgi:hypothetical protein
MDASVVTGAILEALVQGVGNVCPPHVEWSSFHNRTETSYMWSAGSSFAGPFSSGKGTQPFAETLKESVVRSNVVVLMHYALKVMQRVLHLVADFERENHLEKETYNLAQDIASGEAGRMATAEIKINLQQSQELLWRVSQLFNEMEPGDLRELFELAAELPSRVEGIERAARASLKDARDSISCCSHKRVVQRNRGGAARWALGIVGVALVLLVASYYIAAPLLLKSN